MSPTLIFIMIFLLLPLAFAFYCSLYRCDYMQFTKFVGFDNYIIMLKNSNVLKSIGRSFYISSIGLVSSLVISIALALWIHMLKGFIAYFMQIMILIPWVTSMVVASMLWKWIFQDDMGLLHYVITRLGGSKIGFLTNPKIAIYTLIFVMTWRVLGYVMIQVLAGLKAIPHEYEEAAYLDGANKWELFWRVRLPLLKTPLAISTITIAISNINNLTVPLTLLAGGPGTSTMVVAIEAYRQSFLYYHFGEASALSILICVFNFTLTIFYIKAVKYKI